MAEQIEQDCAGKRRHNCLIASDNLRSANEVTRIAAAWLSERAEARPIVSVGDRTASLSACAMTSKSYGLPMTSGRAV
jgi:hypothetical protein